MAKLLAWETQKDHNFSFIEYTGECTKPTFKKNFNNKRLSTGETNHEGKAQ